MIIRMQRKTRKHVISIIVMALSMFTGGIASSDSKDLSQINAGQKEINIFPNHGVPYEIPVGESPRRRAEYLFQVLRENDYPRLAKHLRQRVPECAQLVGKDQGDIEPLDDIVALAVTATSPEIREAFDLMVKGGSRKGSFLNAELQVLYQLAKDNEFNRNDTLAQAVAISNGVWLAMGNKDVGRIACEDANSLLQYGRETALWQEEQGLAHNLEEYPLEAKACWAWRGGMTMINGPFRIEDRAEKRFGKEVYEWNTVSPATLRKMKQFVYENLFDMTLGEVFENLEEYFYFEGYSAHMDYQVHQRQIEIDGKHVMNRHINNIDWQYARFEKEKRIFGVCNDEAPFIEALMKSIGGATTTVNTNWKGDGHSYAIYFDPATSCWKKYHKQMGNMSCGEDDNSFSFVMRPPVYIGFNYRPYRRMFGKDLVVGYPFYLFFETKKGIRELFVGGLPTTTMKDWMFTLQ